MRYEEYSNENVKNLSNQNNTIFRAICYRMSCRDILVMDTYV